MAARTEGEQSGGFEGCGRSGKRRTDWGRRTEKWIADCAVDEREGEMTDKVHLLIIGLQA